MGITLPLVLGSTPDSVQTASHEQDDIQESTKSNEYIWRFRDTESPGLHVRIQPQCVDEDLDEWNWNIEVVSVEWNGEDYVESNGVESANKQSDFDTAVACAEQQTQEVCKNNAGYSHIIS